MYGQFQSPASAAKWIFFGLFGVILMAIVLGANFKDATWLNSDIAAAEANRISIENAHQQATYEIQERLANAQTDAEIQQIQREQKLLDAQYDHDIQALALDISNRQRWTDTMIHLVIFVVGAFAIAVALGGLIFAIAKATAILRTTPKSQPPVQPEHVLVKTKIIRTMPERVPYDPWSNEEYRKAKIMEARYNEQTARNTALGNERNKLPLAD